MGADVSVKAETVSEVVRPARYVAAADGRAAASRRPDDERAGASRRPDDDDESPAHSAKEREAKPKLKKASAKKNQLRQTRIEKMMSKAELARRAGLSVLTIDRVEKGLGCRMDTKRKILEALGLSLADRVRVFGEEE